MGMMEDKLKVPNEKSELLQDSFISFNQQLLIQSLQIN